MNLFEVHRWVIIRLIVIAILMSVIAYLIQSYNWNKEMSAIYANSLWIVSFTNFIAVIVFTIIRPKKNYDQDDYTNQFSIGKISRNMYLFSIIMFISGLMSFSSTAARVAYLFFILGTISMPIAHVSYFLWIRKFK